MGELCRPPTPPASNPLAARLRVTRQDPSEWPRWLLAERLIRFLTKKLHVPATMLWPPSSTADAHSKASS